MTIALVLTMSFEVLPKKVLLPVPSFLGYENACNAVDSCIIEYHYMNKDILALDDSILEKMTEQIDLLFLTNPNNPVGNLIDHELLANILDKAKRNGIFVVVDECFLEFVESAPKSLIDKLNQYDHVIVLRAFTKIYAIPGVRLCYCVLNNTTLKQQILKTFTGVECFSNSASRRD